MTVPYKPHGETLEHFGPMDEFGLAKVGDRTVLVRRKPEGGYEIFDDLVFHGGSGSTLEMRVFSEQDLRSQVLGAGFSSLEIYGDSFPEFGVLHDETWSLPLAGRKGAFAMNEAAVRAWAEQWARLRSELESNLGRVHDLQRELESRTKWVRDLEKQLEERTVWALNLERAVKAHHPELQATSARMKGLYAELRALWTGLWLRARRRGGLSR